MIRRFYADNFRCLVNFELELDELNVLLGANGTGKSSVFDGLWKIQRLVYRGRRIDEVFRRRDLSHLYAGHHRNDVGDHWEGGVRQKIELDLDIEGRSYHYRLSIGHREPSVVSPVMCRRTVRRVPKGRHQTVAAHRQGDPAAAQCRLRGGMERVPD